MAERLPVGAARNIKSPSLASLGSSPPFNDVVTPSIDRSNGQTMSLEADVIESNSHLLSNGSSTASIRSSGHNRPANSDSTTRNGNKVKESDSRHDAEWVEQDEPGVYITFTSLQGGAKDLKRVRFRYNFSLVDLKLIVYTAMLSNYKKKAMHMSMLPSLFFTKRTVCYPPMFRWLGLLSEGQIN